jgi:hypothetical protein
MGRVVVTFFMVVFALLWTAGVVVSDGATIWSLSRQQESKSWPTVTSTITKSDLRTSRGSKGRTNYSPIINYSYEVNGRPYFKDQYVYGAFTSTNSLRSATAVLSRYPVGSHPAVHYEPADPSEATLDVGMNPQTMFSVIFLIPFNAIMLGIWGWAGGATWRAITKPPAGGLRRIERDGVTLLRVAWWSPLTTGIVVSVIAAFVSIFVVGVGFDQSLSVEGMCLVLGIVLGLGVAAFLATYMFGPRWDKFIVIDAPSGTITVPPMGGEKGETTMLLTSLLDVRSRTERRGKSSIAYLCLDERTDEGEVRERSWRVSLTTDRLEGLKAYLKDRAGLMKAS